MGNVKYKIVLLVLLFLGFVATLFFLMNGHNIALLNPKGAVANEERELIKFATVLMLTVVLPVFALTAAFAWRYRASNKKAKYSPDWEHNTIDEIVWWAVPFVLISILAVVTWTSTHALDPYKPLNSEIKPVTIQVVALDWKWLFIYPEQNIATVNFVEFPAHTPINFQITADAPMNSFWIPQLGGQIYAMPGMATKLHLVADEEGNYAGSSANFSGAGFSGMNFTAKAVSQDDFDAWVQGVRGEHQVLTTTIYKELAKPSKNNPQAYYSSVESNLFEDIMMKFMMPQMEGMYQ